MRPKASRASSPNPTANLVGTGRAGPQTPRIDSRRLSFMGPQAFTFRLHIDGGKIRRKICQGSVQVRFKEQDAFQRMLEFRPLSVPLEISSKQTKENQVADSCPAATGLQWFGSNHRKEPL